MQETIQLPECPIVKCRFQNKNPQALETHQKKHFLTSNIPKGIKILVINPERIKRFNDLPDSCQKVLRGLWELEAWRKERRETHQTIKAITKMPSRTIRFALGRLYSQKLIDKRISLKDSRRTFFWLTIEPTEL